MKRPYERSSQGTGTSQPAATQSRGVEADHQALPINVTHGSADHERPPSPPSVHLAPTPPTPSQHLASSRPSSIGNGNATAGDKVGQIAERVSSLTSDDEEEGDSDTPTHSVVTPYPNTTEPTQLHTVPSLQIPPDRLLTVQKNVAPLQDQTVRRFRNGTVKVVECQRRMRKPRVATRTALEVSAIRTTASTKSPSLPAVPHPPAASPRTVTRNINSNGNLQSGHLPPSGTSFHTGFQGGNPAQDLVSAVGPAQLNRSVPGEPPPARTSVDFSSETDSTVTPTQPSMDTEAILAATYTTQSSAADTEDVTMSEDNVSQESTSPGASVSSLLRRVDAVHKLEERARQRKQDLFEPAVAMLKRLQRDVKAFKKKAQKGVRKDEQHPPRSSPVHVRSAHRPAWNSPNSWNQYSQPHQPSSSNFLTVFSSSIQRPAGQVNTAAGPAATSIFNSNAFGVRTTEHAAQVPNYNPQQLPQQYSYAQGTSTHLYRSQMLSTQVNQGLDQPYHQQSSNALGFNVLPAGQSYDQQGLGQQNHQQPSNALGLNALPSSQFNNNVPANSYHRLVQVPFQAPAQFQSGPFDDLFGSASNTPRPSAPAPTPGPVKLPIGTVDSTVFTDLFEQLNDERQRSGLPNLYPGTGVAPQMPTGTQQFQGQQSQNQQGQPQQSQGHSSINDGLGDISMTGTADRDDYRDPKRRFTQEEKAKGRADW
ncbi:hypothetical protein IAR55_003337 [Kwoniella newhampshirensis]|uniref:Uncharacterized protein n=1 Tax=Kwoniella newhampshirensis TaxID=1651941 RepID=A0AAW0Z1B9_9TREE